MLWADCETQQKQLCGIDWATGHISEKGSPTIHKTEIAVGVEGATWTGTAAMSLVTDYIQMASGQVGLSHFSVLAMG